MVQAEAHSVREYGRGQTTHSTARCLPAGFPTEIPLQALRRPVGPPLGCDPDVVSWEVLYHLACSARQGVRITASEYLAATKELPAQQGTEMYDYCFDDH